MGVETIRFYEPEGLDSPAVPNGCDQRPDRRLLRQAAELTRQFCEPLALASRFRGAMHPKTRVG